VKTLIVDNQPEIREGLRLMLERYCPQVTELREANGVAEGLKTIYDYQPDLVFTDVEMDDGTGMDMLSKLKDIKFQVIFITAYNKYAVDAFRFSAIDFLLKPIDPDQLAESVQRAYENVKRNTMIEQLSVLNNKMNPLGADEKKLVLRDQKAIHIVKISDIVYLHAEGVYTTFDTVSGEQIVVSRNIKEYEEILSSYGFVRVHNSYLANMEHVHKFDKADGGSLVMSNKAVVPVSTRKKDVVLEYFKNL
jgi:two-component system, LytTR family, response regulator